MASPDHSHTLVSEKNESSTDISPGSSANHSRGSSRPPKERHRVRFTPGGESMDERNRKASFEVRDGSGPSTGGLTMKPLPKARINIGHLRSSSTPSGTHPADSNIPTIDSHDQVSTLRPRPSIIRTPSSPISDVAGLTLEIQDENDPGQTKEKVASEQTARDRAERLARRLIGSRSAPGSRVPSPTRQRSRSPSPFRAPNNTIDLNNIPLKKLQTRRKYGIEDDTDEDDDEDDEKVEKPAKNTFQRFQAAARRLVKHHTYKDRGRLFRVEAPLQSGQTTPNFDRDPEEYVAPPREYRDGFLSSILKLYNEEGVGSALANIPSGLDALKSGQRRNQSKESLLASGATSVTDVSPSSTGATTPTRAKRPKWYKNASPGSTGSIANLISSSTVLAQPAGSSRSPGVAPTIRPKLKRRRHSTNALDTILAKARGQTQDHSVHIQVHIAELICRQKFILKMTKALMSYGAPTHRLEEYMKYCARVLEINAQFLYIPGCMITSFDDTMAHTTEVKIVRTSQAVDLGKLRETHEIYKEVVHDQIGLDDAMQQLDEIEKRKQRYPPWLLVIMYGLASACVGPFAFGARPIDLPIAFLLGTLLGVMQLIIAPKSDLYSNIFEVSAAVLTSFLARAFGSINNGEIFCFSALAQSAIALILPGYTVLCGSLELQSKNIVAGSVRMVYAVIYSLFLGFGITIGTSFYGGIDAHATSEVTCKTSTPAWFPFIFVPPFTLCLIVINQGKWKQMPVMLFISFVGYVVNHFSALRFASNSQIANTLGALAVGVLANLYSRLLHGFAAATLIPAIFVQVPSGLAASGSLVSGVTSANQITHNKVNGTLSNGTTTVNNGTQAGATGVDINSTVFNVGYSMIQVAIGITVGLFLSALVVYPFGKRRSGLFSF